MTKQALFAGGCFWGMEELFRDLHEGITHTETGYTGGMNDNPTYEQHPGHAEALLVTYEDTKISYRELLDFFFRVHNPTTLNQQGNDRGTAYRSAIFYQNEEERTEAAAFIELVNESGRWENPVITTLEKFTRFWPAEDYHQDYLQKNPQGYTCHAIRFESYISEIK